MPYDRGRNNGVTGLVEVGQSEAFTVRVLSWKRRRQASVKPRRPRGQSWASVKHLSESGGLLLFGTVHGSGHPEPDTLINRTGTITLQYHTGKTQTLSVSINAVEFTQKEKETDVWRVFIGANIIAQPTSTWTGTQSTTTAPVAPDAVETPDGATVKVRDPEALAESSMVVIDVYGLGDDDTSENDFIEDYFTTLATVTGHQLRSCAFRRYGRHSGTLTLQFGLTSTKHDIEYPGTVTSDEHTDIQGWATVTKVTDSATPPATPAAPIGTLIQTETVRLTAPGRYRHVFRYSHLTPADAITYQGAVEDDPADLSDGDRQIVINGSSTPPAQPSPRIADLQLVRRVSRRLTNTPEQWSHTFIFGRNTTEDEVELGGTWTEYDQLASGTDEIDESASITVIQNSATPGTAPPAPVAQFIRCRIRPLTKPSGSYTGYWAVTYYYGPSTAKQKIEDAEPWRIDSSSLADTQVFERITSSFVAPTTPTPDDPDLQLRETSVVQFQNTPARYRWTFVFARNTRENELEHTQTVHDPDDLNERGRIPVLHNSATPPSAPSVPTATTVLRKTITERLTYPNGSHTGLWLHTFLYADNTETQDLQLDGTISSAEAITGYVDITTTVSDNSGTAPEIRDDEYGARRIEAEFDAVTVRKLNPNKALVRVVERFDDKSWSKNVRSDAEACLSAASNFINIGAVQQLDATRYRGFFTTSNLIRTRGWITLRRRIIANDATVETSVERRAAMGYRNTDTFLTWTQGTLLYSGFDMLGHARLDTQNRVFFVEYRFKVDSLFHVIDSVLEPFMGKWFPAMANQTIVVGLNPVSKFGISLDAPPSTLFAPFLQ